MTSSLRRFSWGKWAICTGCPRKEATETQKISSEIKKLSPSYFHIFFEVDFQAFELLQIYRRARMAFSTASTVTPTSAKAASHIEAIPTAARMSTATFTEIANHTF